MSERPDLRVGWATYEAAKYACMHWHYSQSVPAAKLVKVGVWEDSRFIGVILFGKGASPELGSPYKLSGVEVCELTRVALATHRTPVSKIMAIALKFLQRACPGLRLVVSFADSAQGHHGGIYQATNWIYVGGAITHAYKVHGQQIHPKSLHSRYGKGGQSVPWLRANVDPLAERIVAWFKHRYLMPLDKDIRAQILPLSKPYPKRVKKQDAEHPSALGGAVPTHTLQIP